MLDLFLPCRRVALSQVESFWAGVILLLGCVLPASAGVPTEAAARARLVGQPVALIVQPETITLSGPRAMQQVVVSGRYADGSLQATHLSRGDTRRRRRE